MSRRPQKNAKKTPLLLPSQRAKQAAAKQTAKQAAEQAAAKRATEQTATKQTNLRQRRERTGAVAQGGMRIVTGIPNVAQIPSTAQMLDEAQTQALHHKQAQLPLGSGVRLVAWHPCGLYVLDKPEGVLSHPNKKTEINRSLLRAPYSLEYEYFYDLYAQGEPNARDSLSANQTSNASSEAKTLPEKLYLLHRLDSATSGLLLLADNEPLANSVRAAFGAGDVHKTYVALCVAKKPIRAGHKGRWSNRLQREHRGAGGSVVHVRASDSGASAVTDFICHKIVQKNHNIALLELHPISGRTHQLRVHCAQHSLPIIGDGKYGDFRLNREIAKTSGHKRLFLHATALELNLSRHGMPLRLRFTSPPPTEFDNLLANASGQAVPRCSASPLGVRLPHDHKR